MGRCCSSGVLWFVVGIRVLRSTPVSLRRFGEVCKMPRELWCGSEQINV
jgi:hypothetical protein